MRVDQGLILVGGQGTRLGSLARDTPKPMLEVAGRPFVEHVIAQLARFGVRNITLLAGFLGAQAHQYFHGRTFSGAKISVLIEPEPLGTGGALRFAAERLDEQFFLANGDTYFDADLVPLLAMAQNERWSACLLLREIEGAARYGSVELADDGAIRRFIEKPAENIRAIVNAGTYLIRRDRVLSAIGPGACSLERDVLPVLAAGGSLGGVTASGYFVDIGIPSALEGARHDLPLQRKRPAAFVERDSVFNSKQDVICGAADTVRLLNRSGYYVIAIAAGTQSGNPTCNGAMTDGRDAQLQEQLLSEGAHIDAFYAGPDGIARACSDWPIDAPQSIAIGNSLRVPSMTGIDAIGNDATPDQLHGHIAHHISLRAAQPTE